MSSILDVKNLDKTFNSHGKSKKVLFDINLDMNEGEIIGIVGESGSGKTTLLRIISRQSKYDRGKINIIGKDYKSYGKEFYKIVQMIFQDSRSSFNPGHKIGKAFDLSKKYLKLDKGLKNEELLNMVGIDKTCLDKYPMELSGGQLQRIAIARAFMPEPKILLCDEITSALDVCAQAKIIELLINLCREQNKGIVFVSHDLPLVSSICDRIIVMNKGRVVESGITKEVMKNPKEKYTKHLIESILCI